MWRSASLAAPPRQSHMQGSLLIPTATYQIWSGLPLSLVSRCAPCTGSGFRLHLGSSREVCEPTQTISNTSEIC